MEEVKSLGYQDKPPYEKFRSILQAGLKSIQAKDNGKLEFAPTNGAASPRAPVSTHSDTNTFRSARKLLCTSDLLLTASFHFIVFTFSSASFKAIVHDLEDWYMLLSTSFIWLLWS